MKFLLTLLLSMLSGTNGNIEDHPMCQRLESATAGKATCSDLVRWLENKNTPPEDDPKKPRKPRKPKKPGSTSDATPHISNGY